MLTDPTTQPPVRPFASPADKPARCSPAFSRRTSPTHTRSPRLAVPPQYQPGRPPRPIPHRAPVSPARPLPTAQAASTSHPFRLHSPARHLSSPVPTNHSDPAHTGPTNRAIPSPTDEPRHNPSPPPLTDMPYPPRLTLADQPARPYFPTDLAMTTPADMPFPIQTSPPRPSLTDHD